MAALAPDAAAVLPGWNDQLLHGLTFLALTLWFAGVYPDAPARIALWLAAYGGAVELAQGLTATRHPELMDLVADLVGIGAGLALGMLGLRAWCARVEALLDASADVP